MKRAFAIALPLLLSCGGPPQKKNEAEITYRAVFTVESGVNATVTFPAPNDAVQAQLAEQITADGGTVQLSSLPQGVGVAVTGLGRVEASFHGTVVGLGEGGVPQAQLGLSVADGGQDYFFKVNKGGSGLAQVEFEYSASRDCGSGCGGKRSWKYAGPVGLSLQQITVDFTESTR